MLSLRLKLILLSLVSVMMSSTSSAQLTSIWVETVAQHEGAIGNTDFLGMTTYRVHGLMTSESDFLGAVYGNDLEPCSLSTTTSFFQHPAGGSFGTDISAFFIGILPDLNFDSWVTIGLETSPQSGNGDGISTIGMGSELSAFETGENLIVQSAIGGSWFVLPGSTNGVAGEDLSVLLAQVTTDGLIDGLFNLQVFIGGDPFNEQLIAGAFSAGASGCTDVNACNFDVSANANDGSCVFAETGYTCTGICLADSDGDGVCDPFEIVGCEDPEACNFAVDVTDLESCDYPNDGYDCNVNCLLDADGDGICDPFEILGCTDQGACNFMNEATDDDGQCVFAAPYRDCSGNCVSDIDGDTVCDEEEVMGCTLINADNFNTTATDDDGSCLFTGCLDEVACNFDSVANVSGDCVYPEVALDCAGNCLYDVDGDGVCDSFEILGCMDALAENYNTVSTDDDGSCIVLPPSYCGEGTVWDASIGQCVSDGIGDGGIGGFGGPCFGDFDGNGNRSVSDLLLWLPFYDTLCD